MVSVVKVHLFCWNKVVVCVGKFMILPIKQMHFPDHANLYFIPVDNIHLFKHYVNIHYIQSIKLSSVNILSLKIWFWCSEINFESLIILYFWKNINEFVIIYYLICWNLKSNVHVYLVQMSKWKRKREKEWTGNK